MANKAIYPFSADPIHNGHINNIERVLETGLFDEVLVGIGKNYEKETKYLFSDEERLEITKKSLQHLGKRVKVELFEGLLAHYADKNGCSIIIRGLRNNTDFEQEQTMAEFNKAYGLTTFTIPAPKNIFNISSTTIKSIVSNGGLVHEYVPINVKQALEEKLLGVTLVGVTGNTGSGKTTLCKKMGVNFIDVDKLIHEIYQKSNKVKNDLKNEFGGKVFSGGKVDRKKLGNLIFTDTLAREKLANILQVPFKIKLEESFQGLEGIVLLDCAYLVEYDLLSIVNNNVILMTCSDGEKIKRNKKAENILGVQYDDKKLEDEIRIRIKQDYAGNLLKINSEKNINYSEILKRLKKWNILRQK
ncbi:pantetheine-phosphate adenylyltransferase [Patescibacteria group bacterium]|nr:pantetheine-phosphate adenylyltransferase [Patescibacteria group bacterium]